MKRRIKVRDVGQGMFSSERYVAFEENGQEYTLFVDQESVRDSDKTLEVRVIDSRSGNALIELPRASMASGSRLIIQASKLLPV